MAGVAVHVTLQVDEAESLSGEFFSLREEAVPVVANPEGAGVGTGPEEAGVAACAAFEIRLNVDQSQISC
jgi:hypothetical protein